MFFHVYIWAPKIDMGGGLYAWNLNEPTLRERFLDPYFGGRPIMIDGRAVDPSRLDHMKISFTTMRLDIPTSAGGQRKYQSWVTGEDVTERYVTEPPGSRAVAPAPEFPNEEPATAPSAADRVVEICRRFHRSAVVLRKRRNLKPPLTMDDEYDVQYLLHALLSNAFSDVRPEEWTPSYGGNSSRMDFLLHDEEVVVEAKRTRRGLGAKEVTDELIIDSARYAKHPRCKFLVCFVYDPDNVIQNPAALETDLAQLGDMEVRVIVNPQ
jgi:hypothetical protein